MGVKTKNVVLALSFAVIAAVVSIPLGIKSEGAGLQWGFNTPGLFVASKVIAADPLDRSDRLKRFFFISLAIDAPLWFLAICGTGTAITLIRRKRNRVY
jgi:hypothetical protein